MNITTEQKPWTELEPTYDRLMSVENEGRGGEWIVGDFLDLIREMTVCAPDDDGLPTDDDVIEMICELCSYLRKVW